MTRQLPVGHKYTCLVDDDTYLWAQNLTWGFYGRPKYAVGHRIRYGGKIAILRRLVVGALDGERVRNKNRDWLDCRWENLEIQNQQVPLKVLSVAPSGWPWRVQVRDLEILVDGFDYPRVMRYKWMYGAKPDFDKHDPLLIWTDDHIPKVHQVGGQKHRSWVRKRVADVKKNRLPLGHFILGLGRNARVEFINRNHLDYRRRNLWPKRVIRLSWRAKALLLRTKDDDGGL